MNKVLHYFSNVVELNVCIIAINVHEKCNRTLFRSCVLVSITRLCYHYKNVFPNSLPQLVQRSFAGSFPNLFMPQITTSGIALNFTLGISCAQGDVYSIKHDYESLIRKLRPITFLGYMIYAQLNSIDYIQGVQKHSKYRSSCELFLYILDGKHN